MNAAVPNPGGRKKGLVLGGMSVRMERTALAVERGRLLGRVRDLVDAVLVERGERITVYNGPCSSSLLLIRGTAEEAKARKAAVVRYPLWRHAVYSVGGGGG